MIIVSYKHLMCYLEPRMACMGVGELFDQKYFSDEPSITVTYHSKLIKDGEMMSGEDENILKWWKGGEMEGVPPEYDEWETKRKEDITSSRSGGRYVDHQCIDWRGSQNDDQMESCWTWQLADRTVE